jgi:hypothetical protein
MQMGMEGSCMGIAWLRMGIGGIAVGVSEPTVEVCSPVGAVHGTPVFVALFNTPPA